jgi:hypothetical protein
MCNFAPCRLDKPDMMGVVMRVLMSVVARGALAVVLMTVCARQAHAQAFESVGTRAQGFGGAFVAVADDATANWWNPAGLATGAFLNAVIERGRTTEPADPADADQANRSTITGFSAAFPALGLSYYRLRISAIGAAPSTASGVDGREGGESDGRAARSVRYSQFGATVGQSLGDHFVLGSTVKLVRAGAASRVVADDSSLDTVDDLSLPAKTRVGLDLGAMASFRLVRLGVSVRNVHEVNIGTDDQPMRLERQARAGIALLGGKHGLLDAVTLAADIDLTRTDTGLGDVRRAATGAEAWLFARHVGIRGGVNVNAIGDERRPVVSLGASIAPVTGVYLDAAYSKGRDESLEGWTTSLRFTF